MLLWSQKKTIGLHPVVGKTIDKAEKERYYLFDNIDNSIFVSATIYEENDSLWLLSVNKSDTLITKVDSQYISENQQRIVKILDYYDYLQKKDSLKLQNPTALNNNSDLFSITDEQMEQIAKDARRYQSLKQDADKNGLWGVDKDNYIKTAGYWEIYHSKK